MVTTRMYNENLKRTNVRNILAGVRSQMSAMPTRIIYWSWIGGSYRCSGGNGDTGIEVKREPVLVQYLNR